MIRKIIKIDVDKCNGCGNCIPACPEGAIQMIDGKARLVSDLCCDGLGACLGDCPLGAITIEEREAEPYNEAIVFENIIKAGANTIKAHLKHLNDHNETEYLNQALTILKERDMDIPNYQDTAPTACSSGGCPGTLAQVFDNYGKENDTNSAIDENTPANSAPSCLQTWPTQLHLMNPSAAYFDNADVLIAADCVPFAYNSFHEDYIKGKVVINFCPKLDDSSEAYIAKLTQIFKTRSIKSITIVRMQVPCCGGTTQVVQEALRQSGKSITVKTDTISLQGEVI